MGLERRRRRKIILNKFWKNATKETIKRGNIEFSESGPLESFGNGLVATSPVNPFEINPCLEHILQVQNLLEAQFYHILSE